VNWTELTVSSKYMLNLWCLFSELHVKWTVIQSIIYMSEGLLELLNTHLIFKMFIYLLCVCFLFVCFYIFLIFKNHHCSLMMHLHFVEKSTKIHGEEILTNHVS